MLPLVALVQSPKPDLGTMLAICQQVLGYSVSAALDASQRERSDTERFLSCLAAMQDQAAKPGLSSRLLSHCTFSFIMAADAQDTSDILSISEVPFVTVPVRSQWSASLTVMTGSLRAWREAVRRGCRSNCSPNVRTAFNRIMEALVGIGLDLWKNCEWKPLPDQTLLLLEDKR